MVWPVAMDRVTVAVTPGRLPPLAVTSYAPVTPETALTDSVAVVPVTAKSAASTFETASLNVTRQIRLSALVGELAGVPRTIEATRGAVVSAGRLTTISKVSLTEPPLPSLAVTFTETVSAAVGVPEKVRVAAVKLSHEGSGVSLASIAV